MEVPAPCNVTVRAEDAATGEPLLMTDVAWTCQRAEGGYSTSKAGSASEFVIAMWRKYSIEVRLMDGERPVAFRDFTSMRLTCIAGGSKRLTASAGSNLRFDVSAPGTYRLELPEITGYEPPAPIDVEVGDDGAYCGVQLTRK